MPAREDRGSQVPSLDALSARAGDDAGVRQPATPGRDAAVAVLLAPGPGPRPSMLIIRRAVHPLDPWSGHVGLPGGRHQPEDADLVATALRETREEVRLVVARGAFAGALASVNARRRGVPTDLIIHPFVFRLDHRPAPATTTEVDAVRWVPVAHLLDPRRAATLCVEGPDGPRRLPGVRLDHGILWGLTYRMLSDLFGRLGRTLAAGPPRPPG